MVAGLSSPHKEPSSEKLKKNRDRIKDQLKTVDKRDRSSLRRLSKVASVTPGMSWNLKKEGKIKAHPSAFKICGKIKQEF